MLAHRPITPARPPRSPQLQQAQQRLATLQASSGTAGNQAAGAQARLRASVRCLEQLHGIFKAALDATAAGSAPVDVQVWLQGGARRPRPRRSQEACGTCAHARGAHAPRMQRSVQPRLPHASCAQQLASSHALGYSCCACPAHPARASQELRTRLAAAVQVLARMATFQRELGSCLDSLRLLLQRMADGGALEADEAEEAALAALPAPAAPAAAGAAPVAR